MRLLSLNQLNVSIPPRMNIPPPPPPPQPRAPPPRGASINTHSPLQGPRPIAPQQPRPRMVLVARGPPRAVSGNPQQLGPTLTNGPRPRPQMVQLVRPKAPRTGGAPTQLAAVRAPPPPPSFHDGTNQRIVSSHGPPPPPPPPAVAPTQLGARSIPPPPPPPSSTRSSSPSSSGANGDAVAAALARIPSRTRMSILVPPSSESGHITLSSQTLPKVSELSVLQEETSSISGISTDPGHDVASPAKAIGSWSNLASALSEIALSNKLREHLTELKDQVVQQAHDVAMRIHAVHEEETQRIIRQCLDDVGPLKKSASIFDQDPFLKDLSLQTEAKLTWDDVRQILSLRTMAFQQKKLMDIANKTERDFLLEKIEQVLSGPSKLSFARSLESASQCLDQYYQGQEQLLLHQVAFYDEKLNEFIHKAKRQVSDVQSDISIHYQGYEKSKQAMLITYEQMKHKYEKAFTTIHVDADEHWKLTSHLLDHILTWGSEKMKEIAAVYHNNDELVTKRDDLFENIDSLLMNCYAKVYDRISNDDDYCHRSEQFFEKINRIKRSVFAWRQQHTQSMEDRLSYIQLVMDGYYMSILEDLIDEKSELLRLQFMLEQYDGNLKQYLNEFFLRENKQKRNKVLEDIDLEALLKFQTFGPPQQRQNILKLGTSLRASANAAGLSKAETVQLMQELLMVGRRKAMY